jgi:epsin
MKFKINCFLVRERARQVIELLHDDKRIKAEREKAKTNRDKYRGAGNER